MSKVIFFLDSFSNEDEVINEIKKHQERIIFPLSTEALEILQKNNIESKFPEEYLEIKDFVKINGFGERVAEKWWQDESIKTNLIYNDIAIGDILHDELSKPLVKIAYRICLIKKIIDIENPKLVFLTFSDNIYEKIPKLVCESLNINFKIFKTNNEFEDIFHMEKIQIPIGELGKNIKISRNQFYNIKRKYEILWNILEKLSKKSNPKIGIKNKKILLLDFNLITFKSVLEKLSDHNFELFLLNDRRPIIWNFESLKIANKINYEQVNLNNYKIDKNTLNVEKFIKVIEKLDFSKYFSINEIDFSDLIKKQFLEFCRMRFKEILKTISSFSSFLNNQEIDSIISWNDELQSERSIISVAKKKGIFSLVLQHGYHGFVECDPIVDLSEWSRELLADKNIVYGNLSEKFYEIHGMDKHKILNLGASRYDELFNNPPKKENNFILLATSGLAITSSYQFTIKFQKNYEKLYTNAVKSLKKFNNKDIVIKLHPYSIENKNIIGIFKENLPNAKIIKNKNTYDLISKCSLLISPESTIIPEAIILDKPIIFLNNYPDLINPKYVKFEAVKSFSINDNMELMIKDVLENKKTQESLERGRKKYIKECFSNPGTASHELIKFINNKV